MAVTFGSMVERRQLGNFGRKWTGATCQWMEKYIVNGAHDELDRTLCKQISSQRYNLTYIADDNSE